MTVKISNKLASVVAIVAGLIALIPPYTIGTTSSGLTLQSLEHWMLSAPDTFEALHIHWLWIPRIIAFITHDAFSALVIFRALVVGFSFYFFFKTALRLFNERRALIGSAMLMLNVTVLFLLHTFDTQLLTLLVASVLLYLFTSPKPLQHNIGAIIFGLSISIGFWPFILLISLVTVGLNLHHTTYGPHAKQTLLLFGLMLLAATSYMLLEIFYFGWAHVWAAMNPKFFQPREISLIAQGIIIAVFSMNVLLVTIFRRKQGGLSREFQSAFIILGVFFLTNTFSHDEMLHDAVIIVPCLIIVFLDKMVHFGRMAILYGIINLGLFFILPSFQTDPEFALANSRRTKSNDEIAFSYYGSFDFFSFARIENERAAENEARELLSRERIDSILVIINPSTDSWLDAGTLGAEFPNAKFGWFYGYPINIVRINGLKDTAYIRPTPAMPYISGIFEKTFARKFLDSALAPGTPIHESQRLQFVDCRGNDARRRALIDQLIYLQYQGFHHH